VLLAVVGFVSVADRGITAIAAVHLVYGVAFACVHMVVAKHILEARAADFLSALRPGVVAALGITVTALPVRLALDQGLVALLATTLAGLIGAAAALAVGSRHTFSDLRVTLGQALGRA